MGGRYLITGAQLGTIKATTESKPEEVFNIVNHIIGKQFVEDSDKPILKDVESYRQAVAGRESFDAFEEFPLREAPTIKRMASKPGHLVDKYVRIQDIHRAVEGCKKDLSIGEIPGHIIDRVFDRLDWWVTLKEVD